MLAIWPPLIWLSTPTKTQQVPEERWWWRRRRVITLLLSPYRGPYHVSFTLHEEKVNDIPVKLDVLIFCEPIVLMDYKRHWRNERIFLPYSEVVLTLATRGQTPQWSGNEMQKKYLPVKYLSLFLPFKILSSHICLILVGFLISLTIFLIQPRTNKQCNTFPTK